VPASTVSMETSAQETMDNEVTLSKHEDWTRRNPLWRVQFPVSLPNQNISVPGLDLPVTAEYTVASVTVIGKQDAEKVVRRLQAMLNEQAGG